MIAGKRALVSGVALSLFFVMGVIGYIVIEGWTLLDAVYMTVLTFTTVGYEEVRPLSNAGRIFTIFLMIGGVGVMLYVLTIAVSSVVEQGFFRTLLWRRRMNTRLAHLDNHLILCGFGRVGKEVAMALKRESVQFIIIDRDSESVVDADDMGFLYIQGDATHDEILESAHIEKARGLVVAAGNDSDNVFITLSARGLNPNLFIVARAAQYETEDKLKRAGANRVISPYTIGGRRMALSVIRPLAVDFFDTVFNAPLAGDGETRLAEIEVVEDSPLAGATIGECCTPNGIQVLALKRKGGRILVTPGAHVVVEPGDGLIVVGASKELAPLEGKE